MHTDCETEWLISCDNRCDTKAFREFILIYFLYFVLCDIFSYAHREFEMLKLLSSYGPLTVGVDASNWVNYQGGIIQYHCGEVTRNHAVQIVGYDLTGMWCSIAGLICHCTLIIHYITLLIFGLHYLDGCRNSDAAIPEVFLWRPTWLNLWWLLKIGRSNVGDVARAHISFWPLSSCH